MNDRFKFRVWDKENFNYLEFEGFKKGEIEFNFDIDTNSIWIEFDHNKYILEQCTGLKDKNDKLIYEGDIVKFGEFYDNEWNSFDIGKVYWGGKFDYPAFELQCSTVDFDMSNGLSYIFDSGLNIEIIGNIYENPELLEVKNEHNG